MNSKIVQCDHCGFYFVAEILEDPQLTEIKRKLAEMEAVVFKQKRIDELKQQLAELEGTATVGFKGEKK